MSETLIRKVTVSDKGQIAIPTDIQKKLKIKKGDELILVGKADKLLLEKPGRFSELIEDDFKDMLAHAERSLRRDVWPENKEEDELWASYLDKATPPHTSKKRAKKG